MSEELLTGSCLGFFFLHIPNSQIFAFPCSISVEIKGGGGENGLSSPSPSVLCISVDLIKRQDIIKEEINKNCAGPALLLNHVPRYFSAQLLVFILHWLYPRGSLLSTAVGFGALYTNKLQVCSRQELIFALLLKDDEGGSPSCSFGDTSLSRWSWFTVFLCLCQAGAASLHAPLPELFWAPRSFFSWVFHSDS